MIIQETQVLIASRLLPKDSIPVMPADPFNPGRLWGDEKYNLQNMLMREVNFPTHYFKSDFHESRWSDHGYKAFEAAWEKHLKGKGGPYEAGHTLNALSESDFLDYCRIACACEREITGARLVRFTNHHSQYPVYRIDIYAQEHL